MDDWGPAVLSTLLAISLVLAVLLMLVSAGLLERKLADLEYQSEAGIDGVRRIQSWIAVRVHLNRMLLGLIFVFITVLLLAGAPDYLRTWSFRVLFVILLATVLGSSILDRFGERTQMKILMRGEPAPSVDVATIQPEAVADIADAVRPPPDEKP